MIQAPDVNKKKMTAFRWQASWAKMVSPRGQANCTGVPPNQKSKQRIVTTNIGVIGTV